MNEEKAPKNPAHEEQVKELYQKKNIGFDADAGEIRLVRVKTQVQRADPAVIIPEG